MLEIFEKSGISMLLPLYRHIKSKEVDTEMGAKFQKTIIQAIKTDEDSQF